MDIKNNPKNYREINGNNRKPKNVKKNRKSKTKRAKEKCSH